MTNGLILFIAVQFFNVVSSTIKTVATVKSSPSVAAILSTLNYTINSVVTKAITQQDFIVVILVTAITNIIGVPIGKLIIDICSKDRLWIYNATVNCNLNQVEELKHTFKYYNIDSIYQEIIDNKRYSMRIFSYNKDDSRDIKKYLKQYDAKYYIVEAA